jgi:YgiT-type zinc finger domain-containing protein
MNFELTDECGGKCFECGGKTYKFVRYNSKIELSRGRQVTAPMLESWCCEKCGEELFDAAQCEAREACIKEKYPDYFKK